MLQREKLESLLAVNLYKGINPKSWHGAARAILEDEFIPKNRPLKAIWDPQEEDYKIDSSMREGRPHTSPDGQCAICLGNTTAILMENGTTDTPFINLNLFPMRYPEGTLVETYKGFKAPVDYIVGGSFLQWHTTEHKEIHQLTYEQYLNNLLQLAEFENCLGERIDFNGLSYQAFVDIFKNVGKNAGRSIPHGHHQFQFSNIRSPKIRRDIESLLDAGEAFIDYTENINKNLKVLEYDRAIAYSLYKSSVPFEIVVSPKQSVERIKDMDNDTLRDLAMAIVDVSRGLYHLMPEERLNFAYNACFHTGLGIGKMYVRFKPKSQIYAGSEELDVHILQKSPQTCADMFRQKLPLIKGMHPDEYKLEPEMA